MKIFSILLLTCTFAFADAKQDNYVDNILDASGIKIDHNALNASKIISIAREDQEKTDSSIALSMALYLKAPYKDVLEELKRSSNRVSNYKHAFSHEIKKDKNIKKYFKDAYLLPDEDDEIKRLKTYNGGGEFNLSKDEIKLLNKLRKEHKDIAKLFFKQILFQRTKAYMQDGIHGITAYEHCDHGDTLKDGFKGSSIGMKVFRKKFPNMYNYFMNYPKVQSLKQFDEHFYVIKDKIDKRVTFLLKHQIIEQKPNITLIAEREFYISNSLDGIQTEILCTPYKEGTFIALSAQSYTDRVAGFSRKIAVKFGRNAMKEQILPLFQNLQKKFHH
ncbi:MAG: hypothetical protein GXO11_07240 [Epsilonproteobacteria bacterium]|nr:hypothetical protein [Campylobacterota bacterium]